MNAVRTGVWLAAVAAAPACWKVPITPVDAEFTQADAAWFEEEQTLFVFYEVHAEQGLGEPSVLEITWTTDTQRVDWTSVHDLPQVHTHVPVDCGANTLCGSASVAIAEEPRNVELRLRYHRDGDLALAATTAYNVVHAGPPSRSRSLAIYGVFDEQNERIEWRSRHQFPTVRNHRATRLGLRRTFTVEDARYGRIEHPDDAGPYGYGAPCPDTLPSTLQDPVTTQDRAIFTTSAVPVDAATANAVCATSTVTDALGTFTTGARARKNPEVRASFPLVSSPSHEATPIKFFLAPCDTEISREHLEMQRQRLLAPEDTVPTTCIDDWRNDDFVNQMAALFRDAVEAERPNGNDMVLVIGLHRDDARIAAAIEEALSKVVPAERHRNTPRLAGAFVFDSDSRGLKAPGLSQTTLWCPSTLPIGDDTPDTSARTCATMPDVGIDLGALDFGTLPVLPTRDQYLKFIEDFSVGAAGRVDSLAFRAPEFATTSRHVDVGDFGVVTFLDGEVIPADANDAFSYCAPEGLDPFVVTSPYMQDPEVGQAILEACAAGQLPEELCVVAQLQLLPLAQLPDWHALAGESEYELGLFWDFPFLLHTEYRTAVAGSVSAFGFTVPFGLGAPAEAYVGSAVWASDTQALDDILAQCTRFCGHPTFDSAGVYQVMSPFSPDYAHACYRPDFPTPADSRFPRDP